MAITLEDAVRNAGCAAETALANGGVLRLRSAGGDALCNVTLSATAFNTPSAGVAALRGGDNSAASSSGNPRTGTGLSAASTGTACTNFQVRSSADALLWAGTVTATEGGGDLEMVNTSIAENQPVEIHALTYTVPATP